MIQSWLILEESERFVDQKEMEQIQLCIKCHDHWLHISNSLLTMAEPLHVDPVDGHDHFLAVSVSLGRPANVVILGRVEAEALGDPRGVDALDGLAQAVDDRVDLLGQVVLNVDLQVGVLPHLADRVGPLHRRRRRAVLKKDDKR